MWISYKLLLFCAVWCFFDQVHSVPSNLNAASLRNSRECGKSRKTAEDTSKLIASIVDGKNARLGDWPWMVALFGKLPKDERARFFCGGSLIANQWVITAAHCFPKEKNQTLFVRLGDLNINSTVKDGAKPVDVLVDKFVNHPNFSSDPAIINDIALIRLKNPVNFTDNIHPICLLSGKEYTADKYYKGKQASIAGWGVSNEGEELSSALQEASVKVVEPEVCAKQYSKKESFVIDEKVLCAAENGIDTCKGDSGGPLMFLNGTEDRYYLGGVTSGGEGCAQKNFSGVYTRVAQFISFINEVTGEKF